MALDAEIRALLGTLNSTERRLAEIRLERILKRKHALRNYPTPGHLAKLLDPATIQTPMMHALDKVALACDAGTQRRWLISCPPQEGKSQRMGIAAPLWFLLRDPSRRIVTASYEQGLAARSTVAVRDGIEAHGGGYKGEHRGPDQEDHLGLVLDPGRAMKTNWNLIDAPSRRNGGMIAAGIGSALTGRPADVLIVDDPVKDAKQADSELQREAVWAWWQSVVIPRLAPNAIVIVIQTRWHEDDLMGRLLRRDNAEVTPQWGRMFVPARAEEADPLGRKPGEFLVSARGRVESDWAAIRKAVGERWWAALYQCRPAPPAGGIFQMKWIENHRRTSAPPLARTEVVVDPADNEGTGDEAGIIVAATGEDGRYYILADLSRHMTAGQWLRRAIVEALRWSAMSIRYEQSLSGLNRRAQQTWKDIAREARKLDELWGAFHPGKPWTAAPDPALCQAAAVLLARDDAGRAELLEIERNLATLWPVVPQALALPQETGVPVRPFPAQGNKAFRARMVAPLYEGGHVSHVGYFPEYEHQMVAWQEGQDSPDRMDAGVHALHLLAGMSGGSSLSGSTGMIPGVVPRSA